MGNPGTTRALALMLGCTLGASCGSGDNAGSRLTPRVHAEQVAEQGLEAAALADGWAVRFDKLLVSIGEVRARGSAGEINSSAYRIVDLARPSSGQGQALPALDVPGGSYDHFSYTIGPARSATAGNASAADIAAMTAAGASVWIQATATKGDQTRALDLQFKARLVHDCAIAGKVEGDELAVKATLHVDHLLLDNTPEGSLRLQKLVDADRDGDDRITLGELATMDISADPQYRVLTARDLTGKPITNLRQYLEKRLSTIGHVDGENPCTIAATP